MFDFGVGYTEMVVIAVAAIIVIGPKDLPRVLRAFGKTMNKLRGMAREFQGHLDDAMRQAGIDEVKKDLQSLNKIDPMATGGGSAKAGNDFETYFGKADSAAGEKSAS